MALLKKRARNVDQIQQEIRTALDAIRPILRIEGCMLTLARFDSETGAAILDVKGGCPDCDLSVATFLEGIETQLKQRVPQVTSIKFS